MLSAIVLSIREGWASQIKRFLMIPCMKDMDIASIGSFLELKSRNCCYVLRFNPRGGVLITATGSYIDSVEEPVMVVTAVTGNEASIYYQVQFFSCFVLRIL